MNKVTHLGVYPDMNAAELALEKLAKDIQRAAKNGETVVEISTTGEPNSENVAVLTTPCTKVTEGTIKECFQKINEELDELKLAVLDYADGDLEQTGQRIWVFASEKLAERVAEEAADTITAITSMLAAMGIDEEQRQAAQKRVNEKNRERGRF